MWNDKKKFEDFEEEDLGCLDEFFEVKDQDVIFQFPGCEEGHLTIDALRSLVREPLYIDIFSDTEEIANTWKVILPEMLKLIESNYQLD